MKAGKISIAVFSAAFLLLLLLFVMSGTCNAYAGDENFSPDVLTTTSGGVLQQNSQENIYGGVDYSAVYDFDYYYGKYPDLQAAFGKNKAALIGHFVNFGMKEGRQACEWFDVRSYYNAYQDLRMAFGHDFKSYFIHYMNFGRKEGRKATGVAEIANPVTRQNGINYSAVYDFNYYYEKYPDLRKAFGSDDIALLNHFVNCGMKEGRQACEGIDIRSYYNANQDLREAFRYDLRSYYIHYINYGIRENRITIGVASITNPVTRQNGINYSAVYDFNYYYEKYPDLRKAFGRDDIALLNHFVNCGMREGRQACEWFDVMSYYNAYQDLRMAYGLNLSQYYLHYIKYGKKENRVCTGVTSLQNPVTVFRGIDLSKIYDGAYYMKHYPDVTRAYTIYAGGTALVDDSQVVSHFANFGISEGRRGSASAYWNARKTSNSTSVGNIIQYPELPTGCETVALTIALNHYGFSLGKTEIADYYMPYGNTYVDTFLGNPHSTDGCGALAPAVTIAANNFLISHNSTLRAHDLTGMNMDFLYTMIDLGYPVVLWSTLYAGTPYFDGISQTVDGVRYYNWYIPEHCVVLYGYNRSDNTVYISDPNEGYVTRNASWIRNIYDFVGRYAVVIQ